MEDDKPLSDALTHLGREHTASGRLVNLPIYQGSTMLFDSISEFRAAKAARYEPAKIYYGRYGNPASFELEAMLAELEGGFGCVSVSSGLSAVTFALMSVANAGSHVLVADNVYDPSRAFCSTVLTRLGIDVEYFDPMSVTDFTGLCRDNTAAVLFESPGSQTFEVADIPAIAAAARSAGVISIIDGTWATPVFCRPLQLGVDIVVHSGSKYIGGHADTMIGFIVCNEATWQTVRKTCIAFGERPGSQDVFLTLRGLRTLEMRMDQAYRNGMEIANWMSEQPQVLKVLHPAFETCPGHECWKRDFSGASGLFSVILNSAQPDKVDRFVDALHCFKFGASWGGFESLVLPFDPRPLRTATGWEEPGSLVRLSIGNENPGTLKKDLSQAMRHLDD
ncbi:MAG: cystathionine beta-lyase [Pseudomonadota bacterium]